MLKSSLRGIQAHRRRHDALYGLVSYNSQMLRTRPIALWMQDETSGLVAHCSVNAAQNGTYTGVTLANDTTGPFGTPAPYYDALNDSCDIDTATLRGALNGSEGTVAIWAKIAAGAWTDGSSRAAVYLVDVPAYGNTIELVKRNNNNLFRWRYSSGGVTETVDNNAMGGYTSWFFALHTWSKSDDQFIAYLNGAQTGAIQTVLGVWAGGLTNMVIGSIAAVPALVWHGWLGPCGLWDRALSPAEVARLYVG